MDFDLPAEDDPRRLAVREWTRANPDPSGMELARSGYAVPHWPAPYGLGADAEHQLIIDDELRRAGIRRPQNPVATENCGLMMLHNARPEILERYLWKGLAGEEIWCQPYSEPEAGSDLGSLRTTAVRDGDEYVLNGGKIWTSFGHRAVLGFVVARTNPELPKHKGLSVLLVDLTSPGVEVRGIHDMTGHDPDYSQIFFTDVRVPVVNRLGEEGDGWRLAIGQLQDERVNLSRPGAVWGSGPSARELVSGLAEIGALDDPEVRQRAAALYIEGEALRLLSYRALSDKLHGRDPGHESAVAKALAAPHGQQLVALAQEATGPAALLEDAEPFPSQAGDARSWGHIAWFVPAVTIGIGTSEVLKNVIAERMLGMPRDPDPQAKKPWKDTVAR
jgi:3-oxochol-4-en-24-oyl-CoA dehydrogenase